MTPPDDQPPQTRAAIVDQFSTQIAWVLQELEPATRFSILATVAVRLLIGNRNALPLWRQLRARIEARLIQSKPECEGEV